MKTLHVWVVLVCATTGWWTSAEAQATEGFGQFARTVAAGQADEQCFKLDQGQRASWRFDTTEPVDFNLHWHRGNEVHYPIKRSGVRRDTGQFVAPHADDYCLMWENKGAQPVELRGEVVQRAGAKGEGAAGKAAAKSAGK